MKTERRKTKAGSYKINLILMIKEKKKMTNSFTTLYTIITKAAAEAGIRDNENYKVRIISKESDMLEFELEAEWTVTTCYADMESTQILGLMTESKPLEALIDEITITRGRVVNSLKAA